MTDAAVCDVCGDPSNTKAFELSFCARCYGDPAEAPGANIELEHQTRNKLDQISVAYVHDVSIRVPAPRPAQVSVKFTAEHLGHKLVKVFQDEYQAGHSDFDDAIYIADQHRALTEALLGRSGAREAILILVGENNHVEIEAGSIAFSAQDEGATDLLTYLRAALALSRHIQAAG